MVVKELIRKLEEKAPPVKRAPRWPSCFIAPMETIVVDEEQSLPTRICAWFKLVKLWASIRFDDLAHIRTSDLKLYDGGLMRQTKNTGAGKRVRELPIFIGDGAYALHEDWITVGFRLIKWKLREGKSLSSLKVFSMGGALGRQRFRMQRRLQEVRRS